MTDYEFTGIGHWDGQWRTAESDLQAIEVYFSGDDNDTLGRVVRAGQRCDQVGAIDARSSKP